MAYTYGNAQNAAEQNQRDFSGVNPLTMYEVRKMLRNLSCI